MPTDYIAPLALWIVARRVYLGDGSYFVEPAWIECGRHGGMAVFVSRLHAAIYATLRNIDCPPDAPGCVDDWQCIALQQFDLHEHILEMDGALNCAVSFGFACDGAGALSLSQGAPRLCFVELPFALPWPGAEAVFSFSRGAFAAIGEQWDRIGAYGYVQSLERTAALDDRAFMSALGVALEAVSLTHAEPDGDYWTVYDADPARWISSCAPPWISRGALHTIH
jgi:hypothetical protein